MSLAHVLATGLIAAASTGCVFLDAMLGIDPFDPDASFPPILPIESAAPAVYTTGRVTLTLTGEGIEPAAQPIVLDELVTATAEAGLGTRVVWENEDGWYLTFTGLSGISPDLGVYLSLDHITDHEHLMTLDPSRCLATTTQQDAAGLVGTATCRGIRWADYFALYTGTGFPTPIADLPPFDAEITFEAH